ncbi:MAG TPA: Hsp20 family protein [Devosia sp.]|nr:Hsp20 family protein [Devosia sp.]
MQNFDFSPFYRSTVGFDRLFSALDGLTPEGKSSYPPYNIERTGDDAYRISVAVSGFSADEISIEAKENNLIIKGGKSVETEKEERDFLHRGIAQRAFDLRFQLADYVEVIGADLENGLLHVSLKRELPESKKPRQIKITSGGGKTVIEDKAAVN